jgi:hypothetical protein
MARASKKKATTIKVNFKGVESRQTPPEGDYKLEVTEASAGKSNSGNDQIEFVLEVAEGKYKGTKVYFYCPLLENSLWKLHAFLTALGEEVPEDEVDIDPSDLIGKEVVGVLTHETYQGKKKAKMTDFASVDDYEGTLASADEDDDDDKPAKGKKGAKGKKAAEPEDPYEDKDEDELRALYLERELGTKKEAKGLDEDELKEALVEADQEAANEAANAEKAAAKKKPAKADKEPAPKKGAKAQKVTYTTEEIEDMDEEELQAVLDKHDLEDEVDLDDYKKLSKKVAAVVEALEEADLIDDD